MKASIRSDYHQAVTARGHQQPVVCHGMRLCEGSSCRLSEPHEFSLEVVDQRTIEEP